MYCKSVGFETQQRSGLLSRAPKFQTRDLYNMHTAC